MFEQLPVKDRIVHALTKYDRQQSSRRGFNPHALAMYFAALDEAEEMVSNGKTWERALNAVFNDRALTVALEAIR